LTWHPPSSYRLGGRPQASTPESSPAPTIPDPTRPAWSHPGGAFLLTSRSSAFACFAS
jgi:hypothetical protein